MREGYAVAMDMDGGIYPITGIVAADRAMDVALFQMDGAAALPPLPLNDQTAPGDRVFLLSDPSGVSGYFADGIINRFYWEGTRTSGDPATLNDARFLRMNVGTDWSPGSSGAAVVDARGNAVGHVARISTLQQPPPNAAPAPGGMPEAPATAPASQPAPRSLATYVVLHDATPVRGIRLLVEAANKTAATQPAQPAPAGQN